jgi:hypothetical protein
MEKGEREREREKEVLAADDIIVLIVSLTKASTTLRLSSGGFHSTINSSIFSLVCSANKNALSIKFWKR